MDKTTNGSKGIQEKETRIRNPLIHTLRNTVKTLNWKLQHVCRGLVQTCTGPVHLLQSLCVHVSFSPIDLDVLFSPWHFHLLSRRVP